MEEDASCDIVLAEKYFYLCVIERSKIMKNYSFKPTDENILELLRTNSIGRFQYVLRFVTLLSHIEDDCYSIALNGDWGAGKTFFIKQVKLILDTYNPISQLPEDTRKKVEVLAEEGFSYPANYTTVYYDAWANDSHVDPILSLVYATINSNQSNYTVDRQRDIGNAAAAIADAVTERGISNILKSLRGTDQLASIKEKESIKELVKDFLDALINEHGDRLVIFIDELDRCKPDYALSLMERIKHFFDDKRVTFVFAVNLSQLQHTVKSYYGSAFDATRYLDKFFDIQMALPHVNYDNFLTGQLGLPTQFLSDEVCIETAKYFRFSLREMERYVRLYKIVRKALANIRTGFSTQNGNAFSAMYFAPIMLGLQMSDITSYKNFISGKDCGPLLEILLSPNIRMNTKLLCNQNENFDENENLFKRSDSNSISLEDRLKEVYNAIFKNSRGNGYHEINIGQLSFSENTRNIIIEITSLLSPNSDYEFR